MKIEDISKPVIELAKTMQFKLDKNSNKVCPEMNPEGKGRQWSHCSIEWLLMRLREETIELEEALDANMPAEEVQFECADVANFAMMIHDNFSKLTKNPQ